MGDTKRIERRLKLHDLRVLMSVVEGGSMTKAAERLATSQPAISRAIADLEHLLGVRLLDRGSQGIVPTPYGQALIRRCVAAFDELRLGIDDLEVLADPTTGEVRIAAPIILARGFIAAVIDKLARRHPRMICHLWADDGSSVLRRLENREVDLAVTFITAPTAEDRIETKPLYFDPIFVVAGKRNPWSRRRRVTLADLVDEPWALPPPDSALGNAAAKIFQAAGLDLPSAMTVSASSVARTALVAKGRFLTIAGESAFRYGGRGPGIRALPIELHETRAVGIMTLRNRTLTTAAELFIEYAHAVAKQSTGKKPGSEKRRRVAQ